MTYLKVLVVEDDVDIAASLEAILLRKGYEIAARVETGTDAVRIAGQLGPDVILIGIHPGGEISSVLAADCIRQQYGLPVILITPDNQEPFIQSTTPFSSYGYLTSPAEEPKLSARIEMVVEKTRTENRLKHLMQVLRAVRSVNQLITREKDPQNLLNQACRIMLRTRGYESVWVVRIDQNMKVIVPTAEAGKSSSLMDTGKINQIEAQFQQPIFQRLLKDHQPVICNALTPQMDEIPFIRVALEHGYSSLAVIPMVYEGQVFGIVHVMAGRPYVFNDEEMDLLFELAGDLAFALNRMEEDAVRRQTEEWLRKSEARNRRIVETATEGICSLNTDLDLVFANPRLAEMLGCRIVDLKGKPFEWLLFPEDLPVHRQRMINRKHGLKERYEQRLRRANGETLWVIISATPVMDGKGEFTGTLAMFTDITDHKHTEEALRRLNDQLEQRVAERTEELRLVNAALERASRMKDEFLASMSHELRTPLTGVLNLAEILQEEIYGPLNPKQIQLAHTIESSGRHLLGLINDILDLSKIEAGQFELYPEMVQVGEICQASLQLIKGMAQKKHLRVSYACNPAVIHLLADPRRLKQTLVNLLSNAVKFTPENGKIGLSVEADPCAKEVRFTVWDTGIGIAPENISCLFRPFTQLDSSLSRQQNGTGLGLSLVKSMTDLHDGSVSVESRIGEGSRFTIRLPWKGETSLEPAAPNPPAHVLRGAEDGRDEDKPLILIADDNEVNLDTFSEYLQVKGYRVITACHGDEAVQMTLQYKPNLILMDIQMPGTDGLQAIRLIRASGDPQVARCPIAALTALAMEGDRERCLEAGADGYFSKPIALKELVLEVQHLLNRKGSEK